MFSPHSLGSPDGNGQRGDCLSTAVCESTGHKPCCHISSYLLFHSLARSAAEAGGQQREAAQNGNLCDPAWKPSRPASPTRRNMRRTGVAHTFRFGSLFVKNGVFMLRLKTLPMAREAFLAETSSLPTAWISDLNVYQNSGRLKDRLTGPALGGSVRWALRTCISNKAPGDATGLGIISEHYPDRKGTSQRSEA